MTHPVLPELETNLRLRRGEVLATIRARLHRVDEPDTLALVNHLAESDDWVEADLQNDTDIALLDHEMAALRDIDAALKRLDAGLAGVCVECGELIPVGRLLANPTSQTCIACQENIEKRTRGASHASI